MPPVYEKPRQLEVPLIGPQFANLTVLPGPSFSSLLLSSWQTHLCVLRHCIPACPWSLPWFFLPVLPPSPWLFLPLFRLSPWLFLLLFLPLPWFFLPSLCALLHAFPFFPLPRLSFPM